MAKYSQSTDLNYVDIDPLYRSHDLTNWNTLLPPHEADDEKVILCPADPLTLKLAILDRFNPATFE